MNCIVCHHGETRPGTTTVTFHRDGQTIVVRVGARARAARLCPRVRSRTRYWYARMLLERSGADDRAHATELLRAVRATTHSLGMTGLDRQADALLHAAVS